MSKGSKPRPMVVNSDAYAENWSRIFNDAHPNCGTPECCGECTDVKPETKTDEITESIREGQDGQGC